MLFTLILTVLKVWPLEKMDPFGQQGRGNKTKAITAVRPYF
jgi:hypothetical protein